MEVMDWLLADVRVNEQEVKYSTVAAEEEEETLIDSKQDRLILSATETINSGTVAVENTNIVPREDKVTPRSKRRKSKEKWMNLLPRRSSKRLARLGTDDSALESDQSSDVAREEAPTPQVDTTEDTAGKSEINSSSEVHQIVGNELKNNSGEELDQSILNVLLADPSIDFAFKILTDVIPIEEYLNKVSVASPDPTSGSSPAAPYLA